MASNCSRSAFGVVPAERVSSTDIQNIVRSFEGPIVDTECFG